MQWSQRTPSSKNTREDSTHGHHKMVNTEIRLIIFFAAQDGEALYSQQKQDQELTVAQIMNSLLPNSDLNWWKYGKPLDHSVQFSSVAQSCPTPCDLMNCSTPGLPVHHHFPEFTQTHVHQVGDAIQPSHPLSSPFPPAPQALPASESFRYDLNQTPYDYTVEVRNSFNGLDLIECLMN